MAILRSFMYIRKTSEPNTDPGGIPLIMVETFELKLLIKTDCFRSVKYDLNHRSSRLEVFRKKGVLRNFAKFTG